LQHIAKKREQMVDSFLVAAGEVAEGMDGVGRLLEM
jgi:hypothetical protein